MPDINITAGDWKAAALKYLAEIADKDVLLFAAGRTIQDLKNHVAELESKSEKKRKK